MQESKMNVERPAIRYLNSHHSGDDNGRVAEDHGEHEAEEDGVQCGIVDWPGGVPAAEPQPQPAADGQPNVTRQKTRCDEAREAGLADGARGDVAAQKPQAESDQSDPAESNSKIERK